MASRKAILAELRDAYIKKANELRTIALNNPKHATRVEWDAAAVGIEWVVYDLEERMR